MCNVDQPFVYFIYNTRQDIPVIMGKIVDPSGCDGKLISLTSLSNDKAERSSEISSQRLGNKMKRINSLFEDPTHEDNSDYWMKTSTPVCPSGSLYACTEGCRAMPGHTSCIQFCEIKCVAWILVLHFLLMRLFTSWIAFTFLKCWNLFA